MANGPVQMAQCHARDEVVTCVSFPLELADSVDRPNQDAALLSDFFFLFSVVAPIQLGGPQLQTTAPYSEITAQNCGATSTSALGLVPSSLKYSRWPRRNKPLPSVSTPPKCPGNSSNGAPNRSSQLWPLLASSTDSSGDRVSNKLTIEASNQSKFQNDSSPPPLSASRPAIKAEVDLRIVTRR
jgi:hypothetical protein